jgi:hypothetical protein
MSKKDTLHSSLDNVQTQEQKNAEIEYYTNNKTDSIRVMGEEYLQEVEFDLTPLPRRTTSSQKLKP